MIQAPQPEILDNLARVLAWTRYEKLMTQDDIWRFISSLSIEEPDPSLASVLYQKYCDVIEETATALAKKIF